MRLKQTGFVIAVSVIMAGLVPAVAHAIATPAPTAASASLPNTAVDSASIKVTWPSISGAVGYQVSMTSPNNTVTTQTVAYASGTSTYQSTFSGLTGGSLYKFTVTATDSAGVKSTSDQISQVAQSVPSAPTTGTPTVSVGSVTLSWTAPTNTGGSPVTSYTISDAKKALADVTVNNLLQTTVSGLAAGVTYSFLIVANNGNGKSASSTFADATVPKAPAVPTKPSASVDANTATTINVSWTAPADNGSAITGYTVNLYNSSNTLVSHTTPSTTSTKFTSVAVGSYTVKVLATNGAGSSVESPASDVVTIAAASSQRSNTPVITPSTIPALDLNGTTSVSATAPSGDTVTLTVRGNPAGACTISGGVITGVSPGTCTLSANVSASSDGTYAAGSLSKTFDIKQTAQTITFTTVTSQAAGTTVNLAATASSGLAVSYTAVGSCTLSGASTLGLVVQGTCVVTASQTGNATYATATPVSRTITITAAQSSPSPAPSNNGGGGGGGGGGMAPVPAASSSPTPTPSKSATPSPTPIPSSSAKPTPTPSVAPTPVASASSTPTPTPSSVLPIRTIPSNSSVSTVAANVPVNSTVKITSNSSSQSTSVKKGSTLALALPSVAKGTSVSEVLVGPDGKKYVLVSGTTSAAGKVSSPTLKFAKPGVYTVTVTVGKVKKTVKITVK